MMSDFTFSFTFFPEIMASTRHFLTKYVQISIKGYLFCQLAQEKGGKRPNH